MYDFFLTLHSWNRRIILIVGIVAVIMAYNGWKSRRVFSSLDNLLGTTLIGSMHMQLLIGILLYFVFSPLTKYALSHFSEAMKNSHLRYFVLEHWIVMLLSIAIAQTGRIMVHKTEDENLKHKRSFIYYSIAMFLILLMIPYGNYHQEAWSNLMKIVHP